MKPSSPLSTPEMLKRFKNIKWKLLEKVLSEFINNEDTLLEPFKLLVNSHYDKQIQNIRGILKNLDISIDENNLATIIDDISCIIKSFTLNIVKSSEYTDLTLQLVKTIKELVTNIEKESYKIILENINLYGVKEPKKIKFFLTDLENALIDIKHSTFKNYEEFIADYMYNITLHLITEINSSAKGIITFTYIESFEKSSPYIQVTYISSNKIIKDDLVECKISEQTIQSHLTDYKDLNSMAKNNGYKYTRSSGGHGIFENESGHIIVIPQGRPIGKGLSLKIQKDILYTKVFSK